MENNPMGDICPTCHSMPCICYSNIRWNEPNFNMGWNEPDFNYECPSCHGKFNYPELEYPSNATKVLSKCPFCAKLMLGL